MDRRRDGVRVTGWESLKPVETGMEGKDDLGTLEVESTGLGDRR